ncbi:hypothetical protein QQX98_006759 [Neonectria punicea]|uniref:Rhodopsin domain-containing protein n=1 Tax=Neonectria punicea TaxID=979145 RepID=A0ABR1H0I7_9HYPO
MTNDSTIYNTGLVPPPEGVEPNFDVGWTSVQIWTVVVFGITFAFATASLVIRYVTSALIVKKLEADVARMGTALLGHYTADAKQLSKHLLPGYAAYILAPTLTKLAILTILYRINPSTWFRTWTYAIGFTIAAFTIIYLGLLAGPCSPLNGVNRACISKGAIINVTVNIASDLVIIVLPLPTLWRLQMPWRQKAVTGGILTVGSAVLIASIARAPYVALIVNRHDLSGEAAQSGVWSMGELNLGIVCSNLMRMKPFISRYLPWLTRKLELSSNKGPKPSTNACGPDRPSHSSPPRSLEGEKTDEEAYGENLQLQEFGNENGPGLDNRSTESILRYAGNGGRD